ncbi:gliding motility protein GldN [Mucilaginibacter sp. PAMB04274]|uniref:type IX secretion system ring protein PorN/GldN n=1 Tax=Mucilaginibacter sp. PAMB04274 TaxID=3138568 RepID=UPI0031F5FCC3
MKNSARNISIAALCLLGAVLVSEPSFAQRKKAKSTKSRTVKTKPRTSTATQYPSANLSEQNAANTTAQVNTTASVQAAVKDSLPTDSLPPMDGYYRNEMFNNAKAFNYPAINSRDVKFYKRVWRDIDINDPKNSLFNTPGATLADIVLEGLKKGKLTAYEPSATNNDSTFARRLNVNNALSKLQDSAMVDQFDANGNKIGSKMVLNDFNAARVTKFRTKEDIYFDKKRSMVVTRIIGIAPLMSIQAGGATVGEAPAFWLYFPQCRDYFATKDLSDPDRNLYDTTLDDIFVQRKYTSTIVRATGSATNRANTNTLASTAGLPGGAGLDSLNKVNTGETAKLVEGKIQSFKANTWSYKIQKTPTEAEKKAQKAAEKQAAIAEKNAKKAAEKPAKTKKS